MLDTITKEQEEEYYKVGNTYYCRYKYLPKLKKWIQC